MEEKRSNLERFKLVKWNMISRATFSTKKPVDNITRHSIENKILKYGQYKPLVVANVDGKMLIVDGDKMFASILKLQIDDVVIYDLGNIDIREYIITRMLMNSNGQRVDYISIGEAITQICQNMADAKRISNGTGMPLHEVQRYQDLLTFDWDDYLKNAPDQSQLNMFEMMSR